MLGLPSDASQMRDRPEGRASAFVGASSEDVSLALLGAPRELASLLEPGAELASLWALGAPLASLREPGAELAWLLALGAPLASLRELGAEMAWLLALDAPLASLREPGAELAWLLALGAPLASLRELGAEMAWLLALDAPLASLREPGAELAWSERAVGLRPAGLPLVAGLQEDASPKRDDLRAASQQEAWKESRMAQAKPPEASSVHLWLGRRPVATQLRLLQALVRRHEPVTPC